MRSRTDYHETTRANCQHEQGSGPETTDRIKKKINAVMIWIQKKREWPVCL